jgi:hypothetical protein
MLLLMCCTVTYVPATNVGRGVAELDPPSLATLFMQRLGDITMFCCADRSTVCEEEPVVESVMLMKGSKNVVIVDTHPDEVRSPLLHWPRDRCLYAIPARRVLCLQASEFGVQFDSVGWKQHLPALKAIGLASLLSSRMMACAPEPLDRHAMTAVRRRRRNRRDRHKKRRRRREMQRLDSAAVGLAAAAGDAAAGVNGVDAAVAASAGQGPVGGSGSSVAGTGSSTSAIEEGGGARGSDGALVSTPARKSLMVRRACCRVPRGSECKRCDVRWWLAVWHAQDRFRRTQGPRRPVNLKLVVSEWPSTAVFGRGALMVAVDACRQESRWHPGTADDCAHCGAAAVQLRQRGVRCSRELAAGSSTVVQILLCGQQAGAAELSGLVARRRRRRARRRVGGRQR